jgi:hypothetical protein
MQLSLTVTARISHRSLSQPLSRQRRPFILYMAIHPMGVILSGVHEKEMKSLLSGAHRCLGKEVNIPNIFIWLEIRFTYMCRMGFYTNTVVFRKPHRHFGLIVIPAPYRVRDKTSAGIHFMYLKIKINRFPPSRE